MDTSKIILSRSALRNNIKFIKNVVSDKARISIIVKSNAYGHGIKLFTKMAYENGIEHFSVFCYDEAKVVKKLLPNTDVTIMGWISDNDIKETIKSDIEFYVFDLNRLETALTRAKELNKKAKIHLEVETGMNRTGLEQKEFLTAIQIIKKNKNYFQLQGICSHLAGPESIANYYRIQKQIKKFKKLKNIAKQQNCNPKYYHIANSAGTISYPDVQMDLVRIGIIAYGFWPDMETFMHFIRNKKEKTDPLQRILSWKSKIMAIKKVNSGEYIGYGISYLASKVMKTAIIPIGYSNGYSRSLGNKGRVLIQGEMCGVIGYINMNMIIADITDIPDAKIGDEVTIIGKQGELEIKVSAFSNISDELNYEILAHLPENIKRTINS